MAKTIINLTEKQAALVEKMCENELYYKIHESRCSHEYADEIKALLLIVKHLNPHCYQKYKEAFKISKSKDRR